MCVRVFFDLAGGLHAVVRLDAAVHARQPDPALVVRASMGLLARLRAALLRALRRGLHVARAEGEHAAKSRATPVRRHVLAGLGA